MPEDISAITVGLHRNGIALVGEPLDAKRRARSIVEGQFSMPFAAAVALLRGRFGWDDYDLLGTPSADDLSSKVSVHRDESLEGLRHPFGANIKVEARGQVHRLCIAEPSGEPDTFPDEPARREKFRTLVQPVINEPGDRMFERLGALATAASVRKALA